MSLTDLAALGNFVSGIAILGSLIYVALQMRQAAKHSRALITQQRVDRVVDILYRAAQPQLATIILKAEAEPAALSEPEFYQYLNTEWGRFFNAEDTFLQHRLGLLDTRAFRSFVLNNERVMRSAAPRNAWQILRQRFNPEFAAFMDDIVARSRTEPPVDHFAHWLAMAGARAEESAA